jgi:hypothetical protein
MRVKKYQLVPLIVLLITALVFTAASAGKFHFNRTSFSLSSSLVFTGSLAGLGNDTAIVTLTANGRVTALCENPAGQQAPGRNPITVNVQQTDTFTTSSNGKAAVRVVAPDPTSPAHEPSPSPKSAGCPNGSWKVVGIIDHSTDWTSARIVVKDANGLQSINLSYTCKTTFQNGVGTSVQCTQT